MNQACDQCAPAVRAADRVARQGEPGRCEHCTTRRRAAAASAQRPSLVTRPLLVRFISIIGAEVSFYLPLSVVPLYVKSSGSAAGAGAATGVLLAATVAAELATPRLVHLAGYRLSLAAGLVLLGAPALVLLMPASPAMVLPHNRRAHRPRAGSGPPRPALGCGSADSP